MNLKTINQISRYIILLLSLFAMFLVVEATILMMFGLFNPSPNGDEGIAAHLFQFAIVLLFPTGIVYLDTIDWRYPIVLAKRLIIPIIELIVALTTLFCMENIY